MKRLKKETNDTVIKVTKNNFRLEKEKEAIKGRKIRDISYPFEHEYENNYKTVRVGNFWSNNYIEHKTKGDRKTIS